MKPRDHLHLILSENIPPTWGGVARVAFSLAQALGEDGYEVLLCGFDRYAADPLYRDVPFAVEPISSAGWKRHKDWTMAALLLRLWRRYRGRTDPRRLQFPPRLYDTTRPGTSSTKSTRAGEASRSPHSGSIKG